MTLHEGQTYRDEIVSLQPPQPERIRSVTQSEDVRDEVEYWLAQALQDENTYYFSVFDADELVGQILLHDIDQTSKEALIANHLFQPRYRRRGTGTRMLNLLKAFIQTETDLKTLFIITSQDNPASQRIAQKCNFEYVGTSREDPIAGRVYRWCVNAPE